MLRKCLVWDLDNTLWDGVCLEGNVRLKREVVTTVQELDNRGILQSIASRGDHDVAITLLREMKLAEYFLAPHINWLPKSQSILKISKELQVSLDSVAFIDDDTFEREQINYMLPDVLVLEADRAGEISAMSCFSPEDVTAEAKARRHLYMAETERKRSESQYRSREEFLCSCDMRMHIRDMREADVPRVLELMTRTHQLNTTGVRFSRVEVEEIVAGGRNGQSIRVMELRDRFGWYGIIGVSLLQSRNRHLRVKYLAISCRVMGRGIERAFMAALGREAQGDGTELLEAEYRNTGLNKMMRTFYQMMGFRPSSPENESDAVLFTAPPRSVPEIPQWVNVT